VTVPSRKCQKETITLEGDYALVSVGRRPYTHWIGCRECRVKLSDKGMVEVNDHLK
jgi:dihydrolipoamide dehydrogenase